MDIRHYLLNMGFRPHYTGFDYLATAIELAPATRDIYVAVANVYGASPSNIARNIRGELIYYLAEYLKGDREYD